MGKRAQSRTPIVQVQATFDYLKISEDDCGFVKERAVAIHKTARQTGKGIVKIGQWLTEVKEKVGRGQWLPWLKGEFGWSQPTAFRFMQVYGRFKSSKLNNLTINATALYLIAKPSTPEPVRRKVVERAQSGEPMTHAKAMEVYKEYERHAEVPSPPVARQIAIATGMSVAATNGEFVLPMSEAAEEALGKEQLKVRTLYDAIEMIAQTDITPSGMVVLGRQYNCRLLEEYTAAAASWLESLREELCNEKSGARQAS